MRFPIKLPPLEQREVLGVWRLLGIPAKMTRSIECVGEEFFFVSRWIDPDGERQGGQDGVPLTKLSDAVFQNQLNANMLVTVSPDRRLSVVSDIHTMYGEACADLWPS